MGEENVCAIALHAILGYGATHACNVPETIQQGFTKCFFKAQGHEAHEQHPWPCEMQAHLVFAMAVAVFRWLSGNHTRDRYAGEATASGATAPFRNCGLDDGVTTVPVEGTMREWVQSKPHSHHWRTIRPWCVLLSTVGSLNKLTAT